MALTNFGPAVTFAENTVNASPQLLDADVTYTVSTSLSGGLLVVAGLLAEDRVSVLTQGNGADEIGVAGNTISYGGVAIGTSAGGVGGSFTVTFNASATGAAVNALIERLAYANVSDTPTATRDLTLNVVDGAGQGLGGIGTLAPLTGTDNPFNGFDVGDISAPAFLDLDGDGDLDLVSGELTGTLLAWRNTGTAAAPSFTPLTGSDNPFDGIDVGDRSTPAFLDLDGDGDLDLVSGASDGTLLAWRNTGTAAAPGFTALTGSANPFNGIDVGLRSKPAFLDLDGDGDLDLVSGEREGTLLAWRNTGTAAAPSFTALGGSDDPFSGIDVGRLSAPAFLDLDGDGDLDLVSGAQTGTLRAWRNTGTAAAPSFTELDADNPFNGIGAGYYSTPAFVDLDGDGDLDLVAGEAYGTLLAWRNAAPLPGIAVTVTAQSEPPVITSATTASFAENDTAIAYQATATDADSTVTWSLSGTDAALFSIDSTTGAVRFFAAPDFEAPADAGGNNVYDITVAAFDGTDTTTRDVAITLTNVVEQAALTGFGPAATFAENTVNAGPQLLDADVVFTQGDTLDGGRLVVAGLLAEDRVSVLSQGNGVGEIGIAGSTISYGGVAIGTAAGGVGGDFTVTFNANATGAAVDALIQRLAYANISDAPTATRSLTLNVVDGAGAGLGGIGSLTPLTGSRNPFNGFDAGLFSKPAFVDLDGDGDLDLVSGERFGTLLAWRNTGTSAAPVFTALTGSDNPFNGVDVGDISAPAFLDLDGDGDLDLVSGERDGTVLAWRNTGTSAAPVFNALTGSNNPFNGIAVELYSAPAFLDLDGDGDLDLVSGAFSGTLLAWRNTGTSAAPIFTPLTGSDNPFNGFDVGYTSTPAFVDLDGDGDLDLVSGERDGTVLAWRNTGTSAAPVFTALTGSGNPLNGIDAGYFSTPAFLDLDGDGDLDLVSGETLGTLLAWRNVAPLPGIAVTVTAQNDPPAITSGATASFVENGTAIAYQAGATDPDGTVTWSLSGTDAALFSIDSTNGAVRFLAAPDFEAPADAGGNNVYDITIAAFDGTDTTQDVTITLTNVVERASLTGFGPDVTFGESAVNAGPQLLDADVTYSQGETLAGGRLVVAGLLAEDRVSVLPQGNGAGQIGVAGNTISYGGVAIGTAAGGVGGDFTVTFNANASGAAVDALIQRLAYSNVSDAPTATRSLTVHVVDGAGVGLGGIGSLTPLTGSANPFSGIDVGSYSTPTFLDLDGDGDLDLVSGGYAGTLLAWRNTGTAAAPSFTPLTGSNNPFDGIDVGNNSTPAFLDLDGDGDLDLVSGERYGALRARRNTGTAEAPSFTPLTGSNNPFNGFDVGALSAPAFLDLDGDGDLDLVLGANYGTLLAWRNTGTAAAPSFTPLTGSANPFNGIDVGDASTPAFLDLDRDGDPDLVLGASDGTLLTWRNTGTAAAPSFTPLTGTDNPFDGIDVGSSSAPAVLDLDGDGDLDLVSGERSGTLLAWRNVAPLPGITVTVTAQNDPPAITSGATASFVENGTAIAYQAGATDPDGTVTWSLSGTDAALFSIESTTGAVSFLAAPDFEATADAGGNNVYDITVAAFDGTDTTTRDVAITVTNVVEQASLTGFGPAVTFAENTVNAGPQLLDADVAFTQGDTLDGGQLVVAGLLAEDRVSILSQGNGAGEIGVAGSTISYGGGAIGTAAGGVGGDFTVTFNANATGAAVDALIQRLAYANVSDTPTATRSLTLNVVDGAGAGLSSGFGTLTPLTVNPFNGIDVGYFSKPAFLDLDGDGDLDLVLGEFYGTLQAWPNSGTTAAPSFSPLDTIDTFNGIDAGSNSAPAFLDLDGDGDLDLVLGERLGTLQAWRNTGTAAAPSFSPLDTIGTFNGIDAGDSSAPAFLDLDGDGDLDLVSGEFNGTLLAWRNTGTAAAPDFSPLDTIDTFNGIDAGFQSTPAFLDLDGDGDLDLVSGSVYGTLLAWRNAGTAAAPDFSPFDTIDTFSGISAGYNSVPAFLDLDGDGDLDLVSGELYGTLLAWRNASTLPGIAVTVTAENEAPAITSATTANFAENGTGIAYQASATDPDGTVTWSLAGTDAARFSIDGTGAVRFLAAPDFEAPADAGGNNVYDITVAAFDGTDTTTRDVAITLTNVVEQAALTGFGPAATFAENTVNAGPQLLDANVVFTQGETLDGGRLVVAGLLAEDRVSVLSQGNGVGEIGVAGSTISYGGVAIGTAAGGVGGDFTVTFNANATGAVVDALIQRLAYANVSDTPTATRNLTLNVMDGAGGNVDVGGIGSLTPFTVNPFNGIDAGRYSTPAFPDLDGDGDLDLVLGELYGTLQAWRNSGTAAAPSFSALDTIGTFNGIDAGSDSAPAFLDLDGDGDLDLVSGSNNGTLLAWRNTGTAAAPSFSALDTIGTFNGVDAGFNSAPAFLDLDGDGDLDLVSGEFNGTLLAWRNTGTAAAPSFSSLDTIETFNGIDAGFLSTPAFLDLDGDGDLDLASGSFYGKLLAWRNTGTAAAPDFSPLDTIDTYNGIDAGYYSAPAFLDLDGDGDLDLALGEVGGRVLAWRNTPALPSIAVTVTAENDAPSITSATTANFAENGTAIAYQANATDPDGTVTWSLAGTDAALFSIDGSGAVRFLAAPDFEAPADAGGNNVYDIAIAAFDGTATTTQDVAITVTDVASVTRRGTSGSDVLFSGNEGDTLAGLAGNDTLYGGGGNDTLIGGAGADLLDGGLGADSMAGGADDDTYVVDDVGDVVVEGAGGGDDLVVAALDWRLGAQIERLSLSGTADLDGVGNALANHLDGNAGANNLDGAAGSDRLTGYAGDDTLIGAAGADLLDGGLGADSMAGGADNDTYVVDDIGDVVMEGAGGGDDRVVAALAWTLGAQTERLSLSGTADLDGVGNALANRLDGNAGVNNLDGVAGNDRLNGYAGDDTLIGGAGADLLDGGLGADSMDGGADGDTYLVDNIGDVVVEGAGGGFDQVVALVDWTLGTELEGLIFSGTADLDGVGNALANRLVGNAGANSLDGAGGDDRLIGGSGADTLDGGVGRDALTGGAGADWFLFSEVGDPDKIFDFVRDTDLIVIDAAGFGGGLSAGSLDPSRFVSHATPNATSAAGVGQFIYLTTQAALLWDADGMGGAAAVRVATLTDNPGLDAGDFLLL